MKIPKDVVERAEKALASNSNDGPDYFVYRPSFDPVIITPYYDGSGAFALRCTTYWSDNDQSRMAFYAQVHHYSEMDLEDEDEVERFNNIQLFVGPVTLGDNLVSQLGTRIYGVHGHSEKGNFSKGTPFMVVRSGKGLETKYSAAPMVGDEVEFPEEMFEVESFEAPELPLAEAVEAYEEWSQFMRDRKSATPTATTPEDL